MIIFICFKTKILIHVFEFIANARFMYTHHCMMFFLMLNKVTIQHVIKTFTLLKSQCIKHSCVVLCISYDQISWEISQINRVLKQLIKSFNLLEKFNESFKNDAQFHFQADRMRSSSFLIVSDVQICFQINKMSLASSLNASSMSVYFLYYWFLDWQSSRLSSLYLLKTVSENIFSVLLILSASQ